MKQNNKLAASLTNNLAPKVFSLIAAAFIVITLRFVNSTERTVTIPLNVYLPDGYEAVAQSLVPTTIDVTITGDDKDIYLIEPSQITAYADFTDVNTTGIAYRPVCLIYQEENTFRSEVLTVTPHPSYHKILFEAK